MELCSNVRSGRLDCIRKVRGSLSADRMSGGVRFLIVGMTRESRAQGFFLLGPIDT